LGIGENDLISAYKTNLQSVAANSAYT